MFSEVVAFINIWVGRNLIYVKLHKSLALVIPLILLNAVEEITAGFRLSQTR